MSGMRGEQVVVTGADGFIGSHLTERLVRDGASVRAFCLYNSFGSTGWLEELEPDVRSEIDVCFGDIRDPDVVAASVHGAAVVFHLAALIAIPYSYQAPRSFVETNVTGTVNVLEAARRHGVRRMVHTSTSEVYGTPETVPITEDHPLRGQSPYSASKIAADKLCEAWACSFETPVAILRPFNTFGPRQSARAVIPTILGQLLAGATEVRIGALDTRRDFTFVADTVDGFVRAGESELQPGEVVQLGTGTAVSIAELFDLACAVTGQEAKPLVEDERLRPAASEVQVLLSDPSRAAERLGWTPTTSLVEGLAVTARWMTGRTDAGTAGKYHR